MIHKRINNSLLYKLNIDEMDQIIYDYKSKKEFIYCIDAHDILSHIDPFNKLYNGVTGKFKNQDFGIISDNYFAFDLLLNNAKSRSFILKEYFIELRKHKNKIIEFDTVNDFIEKIKIKKKFNFNLDSEVFLKENSSEIFFVLSGYSKSIYQKFIDLFSNELIGFNLDFESVVFSEDGDFNEIDKARISKLFELFPDKKVADFIDAICIYKVFKLNDKNESVDKKYIYFSSAYKTKEIFKKIKFRLEAKDEDWIWLREILKKYENEELLFFRSKKYIFGFSVYTSLSYRYGFKKMSQIKSLNNLFRTLCTTHLRNEKNNSNFESLLYDLMYLKREKYESITVLENVYEKLKEFSKLDTNKDNDIKQLILKIRDYSKSKSKINFKENFSKFFIEKISINLKEELIRYSSIKKEEIDLDRGNDNIISLFNVLPPLFVGTKFKKVRTPYVSDFQEVVENLILFASNKIKDKDRTNKDQINEILVKCKNKNDDFNNLLFLFILVFIRYKSKNGLDSNELVYSYCIKLEENLLKENTLLLSKKTSNPRGIKNLQLILKELKVLELWAYRRIGHRYDEGELLKIISQHKQLLIEHEYKKDYRFAYSLFLTKLNFIYDFIQINISNLERIIIYLNDIINFGKEAEKRIIDNYDINNEYINYTLITLKNSISFCYCIKLDVILYGKFIKKTKIYETKKIDKMFKKLKRLKDKRKLEGEKINKFAFNEKSKTQPVYSYVEAYIEYLESFEVKRQIDRAFEAISVSLYSLEHEDKKRDFFSFCCTTLKRLIEQRKNDLTGNYESFIVKIDGKSKRNFE